MCPDQPAAPSRTYEPGQSASPHHRLLRLSGVSEKAIVEGDAQFRALGRAHYEFSRMVWWLRLYVQHYIDLRLGTDASRAPAAETLRSLGEDTAGRAVPRVISLCISVFPHNDVEHAIADTLRGTFRELNEQRNLLAHGNLTLAFGPSGGEVDPSKPPLFMSVSKTNLEGGWAEDANLSSAAGLEGYADRIAFYRKRLAEYVACCLLAEAKLGWRPSDMLQVKNGRVERVMPYPPEREIHILP